MSLLLALTSSSSVTTMGLTLAALQSGSLRCQLVVAIEGYPYLFTDGPTGQALTAWAGTDWATSGGCLGGLHVELDNNQRLHPWEPFGTGGKCVLRITPDANDTLGIDINRKSAGAETVLDGSTLELNATTITVKDTSSFASAGEIHIGTERVQYSGKTATTFTGCTRGKFAPFQGKSDGSARWGQRHRVGPSANGVNLAAVVSEQPRVWTGRWVGVWLHMFSDTSTLCVKAEAQLLFAGKIVAHDDDPTSLCTVIELQHVLDTLQESTLGREQWTAKAQDGVFLRVGEDMKFSLRDWDNWGAAAYKAANDLVVVAGSPANANEIKAGRYSLEDLFSRLSTWLGSERAANRVFAVYNFSIVQINGASRVQITWSLSTGSANLKTARFELKVPAIVYTFFGFDDTNPAQAHGVKTITGTKRADSGDPTIGKYVPLRTVVFHGGIGSQADDLLQFELVDERGTIDDNYGVLPQQPADNKGLPWGVFLLQGRYAIVAAYDASATPHKIRYASPTLAIAGLAQAPGIGSTEGYVVTVDEATGPIEVRQVFLMKGTFADLLKRILVSTGISGYNDATYDTLGFGLGLGLPGSIIDLDSCETVPNPGGELLVVIDKTTKVADMFAGDLIVRWAFPRWRDGKLGFAAWSQPIAGGPHDVDLLLNDTNKAAPAGNTDDHRSSTRVSDEWQRTIVKLAYNRSIVEGFDGLFKDSITFEDQVAVDDSGGAGKPLTIELRNTYHEFAGTGASVESLAPAFMAMLPIFSRPIRKITRSIDLRAFEGVSIGDIVTVEDVFARDPDTGLRGIQTRRALVTRHRYSLGGWTPGADRPNDMGGEVDLLLLEINRTGPYSPAAQVDETQTNAGYNAGTKVLTCYAHKYSNATQQADATRFLVGDAVRVVERDPSNPASPLTWTDVVFAQTGNTITLTTGLAGWDNTKTYVVISDTYSASTASEHANTYQADAADHLVENLRVAYQLVGQPPNHAGQYTPNTASDPICLPPDLSYGDGKPLDVAHEVDICRLLNNLVDYKGAHSAPFCWIGTGITQPGGDGIHGMVGNDFLLVYAARMYLTQELFTGGQYRKLDVAAWYVSQNTRPGTDETVRVTIAQQQPAGQSLVNVNRGSVYVDASWTTQSTTWQQSVQSLSLINVKGGWFTSGLVWVLIECTKGASTRGLARCQESRRFP